MWVDHVVFVDADSRIILDYVENFSIHVTIQWIRASVGAEFEQMSVTEIKFLEYQPQ